VQARGLPEDPRCRDLLDFWFGTHAGDAAAIAERNAVWFGADAAFDAVIRERHADLREAAVSGQLDAWLAFAHGRLALVILLDQFSRNLFRGDARAFAHDAQARAWSMQGVLDGVDRTLHPIERVFFYLPFEHSEALADQQRAVALFSALHDEVPTPLREAFADFLGYARRHHDVIARFGRFPHRNATLGRASTTEEVAFLQQPGASF
jgi:uncharacterized protein (DUF924 family)